ncbi:MAG: diacylglycerol kinase family protein [Pirellulales bacterium]|nr:diacylglycerol kinase family protein [Pirellulales bacterium]
MCDQGPDREHWRRKFGHAFRGVKTAFRGQSSFFVHYFFAAAVVAAAVVLQVSLVEASVLLLCIAGVLVAEMFNTALEHLAKAVTEEYHPAVKAALDVGSGGVLMAAVGAVLVGLLIFGPRLLALLW